MPQYIVLKVTDGDIPPLGGTGSADVYRGDHPTEAEAITAAAAAWRLGPNVYLWADPAGSLTRYITSVSATTG